MTTTLQRPDTAHRFARYFSLLLTPALLLAIVVVLAGLEAGLGAGQVLVLLVGVAVIPGVIYKTSKPLFRRWDLADHWRTDLVALLSLIAAVVCYLIPVPAPVPATVLALFVGNIGLTFFRRWLNVSAHVSVLVFATLWVVATLGGVFWPSTVLFPLMILTRVSLRQHTWREAVSGSLWGLITFSCYMAATYWSGISDRF